jgi:protein-S-isoprenylcysteine O-methyltransferase Ste14
VVRNPIYLGMFGLMVATGLAYTTWWALLAAVILFLSGNRIRIRSEEKPLRETFGVQFDEYASRVPAFFPAIFNYFRKYSGSVIIRFIASSCFTMG